MKKLTTIISIFLMMFLFVACKKENTTELPDFPEASADKDSWEQWKDYDNTEVTVSWYVDLTGFSYNKSTIIANKIKEITGVNIEFQTPATADGAKLSTMISGNQLTDLVTVAANTPIRIQLAEDGDYVYSITDLAEKWAPSMLNRLNEEMVEYYKGSDGKLYGIPSLFYSLEDLREMKKLHSTYASNGAIVARKDYLDAYHEYMFRENPNWDPASVANPEGILEMALWVKQEYNLDNSNPTVALSPFESHRTHGSVGLRWLMEYFSVLQEDSDGNFVYQWSTPEFKEMMLWLNKLYLNGLMTSGNMTATAAQVGTYISNGLPFIYIGSPQDYVSNFKYWAINNPKKEAAEYVPIIFTNSKGTVPQLSVTGNSYMYTMVSKNAKRPDRIIKLLDFLYSEEGQKLIVYGIEASGADDQNGTFYYVKEPGETGVLPNGETHTYKYGLIDYTDKVKRELNNLEASHYGFSTPTISQNGAFPYLSNIKHGLLYNYSSYISVNLKTSLIPYTYIYRGFEFELDPRDKDYMTAVNIESNLRLLWMEYYAEIIVAKSQALASSLIDDTLASAKRRGLDKYLLVKNKAFQTHKEKYGIKFASPINDPNNQEYKTLKITSVYGDVSYRREIPEYINRK